MANKLIPAAKDAPPYTAATIRELTERMYALENSQGSAYSEQNAGSKGLGATVQSLSRSVYNLNSKYSVFDNGDFNYNSGAIPSDSTFREHGAEMAVNVTIPNIANQLIITVGCGEISGDCKVGDTALGEITFKFTTAGSYGTYFARLYLVGGQRIGIPVSFQRAWTNLAPGNYGITAVTRSWSGTGGTGTSSMNFATPYLRADIVGAP